MNNSRFFKKSVNSLIIVGFTLQFAIGQNPIAVPSISSIEESNEALDSHSLYSYMVHQYESGHNPFNSFDALFETSNSMYNLSESRFVEHLAIADTYVPHSIDRGNTRLRVMFLFQRREYSEICNLLSNSDLKTLDDEVLFKLGYSQFSQKRFSEAINTLSRIDNSSNLNTNVTYYKGMSYFFLEDYQKAIEQLKSVDNIFPYDGYNPYYIVQIYFGQEKYSQVISYGKDKLTKKTTLNKKEIEYLIGQSYYAQGDYQSALTYLELYENNTEKLTEQDFYQLGLTNDRLGNNEKARQYLSELIFCNSELCEHAQYILAKHYISTGNEKEALALYSKLSKSSKDTKMQEEATYNSACLHYYLDDTQSSLAYVDKLSPDSKYYDNSQELSANILSNSEDLETSIAYLKNKTDLSPTLTSTLRSLQFEKLKQQEANQDLSGLKSGLTNIGLENLSNKQLDLIAYWSGLVDFNNKDYLNAERNLNQSNSLDVDRADNRTYMLGYSQISNNNIASGLRTLEDYIESSIMLDKNVAKKKHVHLLLADAYTTEGSYTLAQNHYEKAAKMKSPYAIIQLAEIARVQKDYFTRIYLLESLTEQYPNHPSYQRSLFEIGETHIQLKEITRAIEYLDKSIEASPTYNTTSFESYLRLGLCYYNLGKPTQAIDSYKVVAEHSNDSGQKLIALEALKEIYLNDVGNTEEFFEFAENTAQVEYSSIEKDSLAYLTNQKYFIDKDYVKAIPGYKSYLKKFDTGLFYDQSTIELADCHYELKQYDQALVQYNNLHDSGSEKLQYRSLIRSALINLNFTEDYKNSLESFNRLIPMTTDNFEKKELIDGAFFCAIKTSDESLISLADAIINDGSRSSEEIAKANYHKGKKLVTLNEDDKAIQAFTEVTRKSKSNIAAESNYLIAEIFYLKGSLDSAERQANETTKRAKSYPYWIGKSLLLLTDIYIDKKDLLNARAACEVVLENFKENLEINNKATEHMQIIEVLEAKESRILQNEKDTLIFQEIDQNN